MPASRTVSSAARRSALGCAECDRVERRPERAAGEDGTPLTWTDSPSRSMSWSAVGPAASDPEPDAAGIDDVAARRRRRSSSRTACRAGSPCVCGHQRRDVAGSAARPSTVERRRLGDGDRGRARRRPVGPSTTTVDASSRTGRPGSRSAGAGRVSTPVVAVEAGPDRQVLDRDAAPSLEPDRPPRADGDRARARTRDPAEQRGPEPAQVVVGDEPRPPARSRPALAPRDGSSARKRIDELVAGRGAARRHRPRARANIESLWSDRLAVEQDVGDGREAVEAQDDLLVVGGRRGVERRPEPPVLRRRGRRPRGRRPAGAPAAVPGHGRGQPVEPVEGVGVPRSSARRRRDLPAASRSTSHSRPVASGRSARSGAAHAVCERRVERGQGTRSRPRPGRRIASVGSNGAAPGQLEAEDLAALDDPAHRRRGRGARSPSSQSTCEASSSKPAPAIRNVAKVNAW